MRFEIEKILSASTDRVKSVDFHPREPWMLNSMRSGDVYVWDYEEKVILLLIGASQFFSL